MTDPAGISNLLDAALYFAERGFRVFPVKPFAGDGSRSDGKVPALKGWPVEATANLDQIVRWFSGPFKGFNLGIAADNLVVIDVDTLEHSKGEKDGPAELQKLEAENSRLPDTLAVRTATGGLHLYFADRSGAGDTFTKGTDKLGPGLDIQTGTGAYLVGPFSEISGTLYAIEREGDIADLPDWVRERIRDVYIERPPARPAGERTEPVSSRYVNAAITGELRRLDECQSAGWGGPAWDNTTYEVACNLVEISNSTGADYPLSAAYSDFMQHAPADEKFGPRQHEAKWHSAIRKVAGKGRDLPAARPATRKAGASPEPATAPPPAAPAEPSAEVFDSERYFAPKLGFLVERMAHDVKFDLALGPDMELWHYSSGIFEPDPLELLTRVTQRLGDRYRPGYFSAVSDFVRALPGLPRITVEQPDQRHIVLNNGVYSWEGEGELLEHSPEFGAITKLPIDYDAEALCPEFDRYLADVVPPDTISLLWEVTGYLLMFGNPLQRAVILQGPGGNGKSTYLRVLQALIGKQNLAALSLRQITEDRFALAGLLGKTANLAGDIDSKYLGDASRFKQVVGGDLIEVERKFGQPFSFEPYAVPVFSANEFWKTGDTTHGYWRRWLPIPFPYPVEGKRRLDERDLFAETPGIFNRAMIGLRTLMARGDFELSKSVTELRDRMESAADVLADWFSEDSRIIVNDPGQERTRVPRTEAYLAFKEWCRDTGHKVMTSTNFYKRLGQLGYVESKVQGTRYIIGLDVARFGGAPLDTEPAYTS